MPRVSSKVATVQDMTKDHVLLTWSNVVVAIFRRETTLASVASIQRIYNKCAAAHRRGIYMLTIVEEGAPMPPAEVREALARFLESGSGKTLLSGVVHEGTGFRAAAVRSVVTGLAMLARLPYPHRVFASVELASHWFASAGAKDIYVTELLQGIDEARRRGSASGPQVRVV